MAEDDALTPISPEARKPRTPTTAPPRVEAAPPRISVVAEPAPLLAEPPRAVVEPPRPVVEPPRPLVEPPRAVAEPPRSGLPVVQRALPGGEIAATFPVDLRVCRALWRAHLVRSQAAGDVSLIALSSVVLGALDGPSVVVAYQVTWRGRSLAVWVDHARAALLAIVEPADVFLAGLD